MGQLLHRLCGDLDDADGTGLGRCFGAADAADARAGAVHGAVHGDLWEDER